MANVSLLLSGGWRVSSTNPGLDLITRFFSATYTGSTFTQQEVVILPTVSDYILSLALFSAPIGIFMTSTNTVRVNFPGQASSFSAASASVVQFKDLFVCMATSAVLPSSIHIANSGTDSAMLTVLLLG